MIRHKFWEGCSIRCEVEWKRREWRQGGKGEAVALF